MSNQVAVQFDEKKSEAFADSLVGMLNGGALALMVSIGHRTGLFDKMQELPPATSEQIAKATGLDERYVREWLGAMTVGGIIECVTQQPIPQFVLPEEHAVSLTRASQADNIAVFAQYISVLGSVEDRIVECFKNGGGVSYAEFDRFHDVMAEDSGLSVVSSLIDTILPLVPGLIDRLKAGINVLDVGCGMGRAMNLLAKTFPNSTFNGYDLSEEAISAAQTDAARQGSTNVTFEVRDLTTFSTEAQADRFDLITAFDAIHDQARPDLVLSGIRKALKPEGTFLMQDIAGSSHVHNNVDHPIGPLLYTISCMHCMTVSLAQDGMGLGAMWGKEKALEMIDAAGFGAVNVRQLSHDIQNYYYVIKNQ